MTAEVTWEVGAGRGTSGEAGQGRGLRTSWVGRWVEILADCWWQEWEMLAPENDDCLGPYLTKDEDIN